MPKVIVLGDRDLGRLLDHENRTFIDGISIFIYLFVCFKIFIFIMLLYWGTLWHLQKYLQYILVKFTPPSFPLPLSPS
jgi:hypothetical protein